MIVAFVIALTIFSLDVQAEICTVCSNSSHVMNDESARIIWPPNNPDNTGLRCSEVAEKAVEGFFSNCTVLHSYSDVICSCGDEEPPFTCPLCDSNNQLPEPKRVVAGKSCEQWQQDASDETKVSSVDCTHYQTILGAYCGCDISEPNYFDGYCRLCGDTLLPDFSQKVTYQSGRQAYCVEVEVKLNTNPDQYNCESYQGTHEKACGCTNIVELPTLRPSSRDESSATFNQISLLKEFTLITFWILVIGSL